MKEKLPPYSGSLSCLSSDSQEPSKGGSSILPESPNTKGNMGVKKSVGRPFFWKTETNLVDTGLWSEIYVDFLLLSGGQ